MKTKNANFHLIIIVLLSCQIEVVAQIGIGDNVYPNAALERTEVRTIYSQIVGQEYELFISLPYSYFFQDTSYPVIFLTDSYRAFSILKGVTDGLTIPHQVIPEVFIVGIGYGGEETEALINWSVGRTRDLTPVQDSLTESFFKNTLTKLRFGKTDVKTGGAQLFLDFIRLELFPFVASNYRIDPNHKILCGYSFGGLFGLYTLFHEPDMFNKYLIGSPSLQYKNGISFEYEAIFADTHSDLAADVFISCGTLDQKTAEDVERMTELLFSRNYQNLKLVTTIFENEDHVTCFPAAVSRGLVELFNNQK